MEDFVTYEQAVKLKELGFNWECNQYYWNKNLSYIDNQAQVNRNVNGWGRNNKFSAPTLSQATKWLREVHNLHIEIASVRGRRWTYTLIDTAPQYDMYGEYYDRIPNRDSYPVFDTYESALSSGIDAALKLIEEKGE